MSLKPSEGKFKHFYDTENKEKVCYGAPIQTGWKTGRNKEFQNRGGKSIGNLRHRHSRPKHSIQVSMLTIYRYDTTPRPKASWKRGKGFSSAYS